MSTMGWFALLFFFCLIIPLHASYQRCPGISNFTTNSTYHANVNLLLDTLITATAPSGYANYSLGQIPDRVFGLALCRGDVLVANDCRACLSAAVDTLRTRCPYDMDAATWEDVCILAYSSTDFSANYFKQILYNTARMEEPERYSEFIGELMDALIDSAAYKTQRMFAMSEAKFTSATTVQGLVQCTRDQSNHDCSNCLRDSLYLIQNCCFRNHGGVVVGFRCYLRYEAYEYFNMSVPMTPLPPLPAAYSTPAPPPPPPSLISRQPPPPPPVVVGYGSSSDAAEKNSTTRLVAVLVPVLCASMIAALLLFCFWRRRSDAGEEKTRATNSLLFDLDTLKDATNNFSDQNKLGEGGFGPVYKGLLPDGQEIAVKRLSTKSQQGLAELRNEANCIAKLEHKNLVRLLGYSLAEEKLLVYEFLPNRSLDKILFDPGRCGELNWGRRCKIIEGIARGLIYLHQEAPLKVIHRDLKPGNILLDKDMNAKISDFGLSKLFHSDRSKETASRIVGTNGYIAPEYACHRHFSTKSDVYSYGMLVLEIITGRRINKFDGSGRHPNIQTYVWKYWRKGTALRIVDRNLGERYDKNQAYRCIHMALLCIQDDPQKRPSITSVVLMLDCSSMTMASPSPPGLFIDANATIETNASTARATRKSTCPGTAGTKNKMIKGTSTASVNDITISIMDPR